MAIVKVLPYEGLYMEFADAQGNYTHYAGMNTKNWQRTSDLATSDVPDASDEGIPATKLSGVKAISEQISGQFTLVPKDLPFYMNWQANGDARQVKCTLTLPQADGGGHWTTAYVLADIKITGNMGEEAIVADLTLNSSGKLGTFQAGDEGGHSQRLLPTESNP